MTGGLQRWTFHGGRLREARAAYPDARGPWIDLSTGINPDPWPGAAEAGIDWHALPDESALAGLEAAAAHHCGVDPAHLCALPGTEIGLRLLGDMLPGRAVHVAPGYRTHAEMTGGAAIDPAAMAACGSSIILANPNNPDGRLIDRATLADLLHRMAGSPHWLVIDEAFADATGSSMAGTIGDDRPLVIFRSFGKFFGLAGVRLGFVLGPRTLIAHFRARLGSWPVSAAAIAIGTAAYRDADWIAATHARLPAGAAALDAMLAAHGLVPRGHCPLFRLVETAAAATLFDRLARQAILTRPFDYDPRWLRIGLPGGAEAFERLDRALGGG